MEAPRRSGAAAPALAYAKARPGIVTRVYHGWVVLLVAAAAMVGTLPARTQGLGLVTEPLLADLGIGRVAYAELNLWATLGGALFALAAGRALDRAGARAVLTLVALALGVAVCGLSRAGSFGELALWVTLTRGLGQSALSTVSLALVGRWFVRRIDSAMAVYGVVTSIGFMLAFPLVGAAVQAFGWRAAWLGLGLALAAGLAPLAFLLVRRGPEECGLAPDGESDGEAPGEAALETDAARRGADALPGHSFGAALSTPAFWVFALGAALYALVASGIGLFNEAILAERGFPAEVYHQTLAVTALTALAGNGLGGWLARRVALARLLSCALAVLAAGLLALPHLATLGGVMAWAGAMGLAGGLVMVLFFATWPRVFGRRALGRIQGAAQAVTVLASALGPLALALCVEWTGSYAAMFRVLALVVLAVGAAALLVRVPSDRAAAA